MTRPAAGSRRPEARAATASDRSCRSARARAVAGLNRYAVCAAAPAPSAACRSGVTSSRIQKPRPCVPAIRSEQQARAVVLHLQVAHRDRRHVDAAATASGRRRRTTPTPACRWRRRADPSGADPRESSWRRRPRDAGVDLRPRLAAVVRAIEVRLDVVEAQRVRRRVRRQRIEVPGLDVEDARPRLDRRRRHVGPRRRRRHVVTWMLPSSVPAQMTRRRAATATSAVMLPIGPGVTVLAYLPAVAGDVPRLARAGRG